ncbi:MAG: hypothetical protein HOC20_13285 [Chloroflexi bacterium]|nr:hypothetical protein [Chloroflexota bacterium]
MIWLRRLLTIPLIILFLALFIMALIVTQFDNSFGNASFYNDQMEKADIYNSIYDDVLPAALDDVDKNDTKGNNPVEFSPIREEIVSAASQILPPEWLQAQFESATNAIIPYLLGDTDEFTYTLPLRERVDTAIEVIKSDILHGEAYSSLYDDFIDYAAEEILKNLNRLPYDLTVSQDDVEASLKIAVPEEWLASQLETALNQVKPYFTNDSQTFTVSLEIVDIVDAIASAAIDIVSGEATYEYLLDELITPTVEKNIGTVVDLPFGITLSRDEISSAIKAVMDQSWVDARLEEVVHNIAAYATGEIDTIDLTIDLTDRKATALEVISDLGDTKLKGMFNTLPQCSITEFASQLDSLSPNNLPDCRPAGVPYQQFKNLLGVNIDAIIANAVDELVGDEIPDRSVFTEEDLRKSMGEGNDDFLETAREYVSNGWVFDEVDIVEELQPENIDSFNDIRSYIGSGYTVTEEDLRDAMFDNDQTLNDFDDIREQIHDTRNLLWLLWIISILLLISIGFLGGQSWRSRSIWALAVLFGVFLIICIAISITDSQVDTPDIEDDIKISEFEALESVLGEKSNEVLDNLSSSMVCSIRNSMITTMAISIVVMLGIIGWSIYNNRRITDGTSPTAGNQNQGLPYEENQ